MKIYVLFVVLVISNLYDDYELRCTFKANTVTHSVSSVRVGVPVKSLTTFQMVLVITPKSDKYRKHVRGVFAGTKMSTSIAPSVIKRSTVPINVDVDER